MKVIIEKYYNGYTVSKAVKYSTITRIEKFFHRGYNFLGQSLGISSYISEHENIRYKAGEALSSVLGNIDKVNEFIKVNELSLISIPLHVSFVTNLDSRYFRLI